MTYFRLLRRVDQNLKGQQPVQKECENGGQTK